MNWQDHIVADPNILLGKPTIKGTRISVDLILSLLAQGWTENQIFESYPHVTRDDLQAVFAFVHECLEQELRKTKIVGL